MSDWVTVSGITLGQKYRGDKTITLTATEENKFRSDRSKTLQIVCHPDTSGTLGMTTFPTKSVSFVQSGVGTQLVANLFFYDQDLNKIGEVVVKENGDNEFTVPSYFHEGYICGESNSSYLECYLYKKLNGNIIDKSISFIEDTYSVFLNDSTSIECTNGHEKYIPGDPGNSTEKYRFLFKFNIPVNINSSPVDYVLNIGTDNEFLYIMNFKLIQSGYLPGYYPDQSAISALDFDEIEALINGTLE